MTRVTWDSSRALEDISSRLGGFFGRPPAGADVGMPAEVDPMPRLEIGETDSAYRVAADIPGLNKEDVTLTIREGMLDVTVNKSAKAKPEAGEIAVSRNGSLA